MPASRLKTISDKVLADTIVQMRDDWGLWDHEPTVYKNTRRAHEALGNKMSSGVREVVRRVEEDGLKAHLSLKPIFEAAIAVSAADRRDASAVYDVLEKFPHRDESEPKYAF